MVQRVCIDLDLGAERRKHALRVALRERTSNRPAGISPEHGALLDRFVAQPTRTLAPEHEPIVAYMAMVTSKMWSPGRTLKIGFLDGSTTQTSRVCAHARSWLAYANLDFAFPGSPPYDVRISFSAGPGSWSAIGTDCLTLDASTATMNLGWLTDDTDDDEFRRVVLHEFGHVLGCIHEHQNPAGGIQWNKPVVYAYYEGPPNQWQPAQVDQNVFAAYDRTITQFTALDPASIMMYPIPAGFTTDGFSVGINDRPSPTDIAFVRKQYPGRDVPASLPPKEGIVPQLISQNVAPVSATQVVDKQYFCLSAKGVFDVSYPYGTSAADMDGAIDAYAKECDKKSLALFFHGGLVSEQEFMTKTAPPLISAYGSEMGGNAYPYCFVWESGFTETVTQNLPTLLLENLKQIAAETIFTRLLAIIVDKVRHVLGSQPAPIGQSEAAVFATSAWRSPNFIPEATVTAADIEDVERAVTLDPMIDTMRQQIASSIVPSEAAFAEAMRAGAVPTTVRSSSVTLLSPEIVSAIGTEVAQTRAATQFRAIGLALPSPVQWGTLALGAGKVLVRIVQRFASGRAHGLHNTIVEEILRQFYVANVGYYVWKAMKDSTALAFGPDAESCVGTRMIQKLIALYDVGKRPRVTLIGHSAGSVYIANFLAAMDAALRSKAYREQVKFDVIVMAPAVRADLFAATISQYGGLVGNFRWFSMSEELEAQELLVQDPNVPSNSPINDVLGQIYTSSLLYFIAGVLEDADDDTPIVGMQRYFSKQRPYTPGAFPSIDTVGEFLRRDSARQVWSDTTMLSPQPPEGMRCGSHHHGGFPTDPATLESVCYLLRTGNYAPPAVAGAPAATAIGAAEAVVRAAASDMFVQQCTERLKINEGCRNVMYRDSMDIPTIGIGFNLERGDAPQLLARVGADYQHVLSGTAILTEQQIFGLFNDDLIVAIGEARRLVAAYAALDPARQFVIVDMIFNMGPGEDGFGGFHNTIHYIDAGMYALAARNMRDSRWYLQVGDRAKRDVAMMYAGRWVDPTGDGSDVVAPSAIAREPVSR